MENTKEWTEQPNWEYHERQFRQVYRSTECFCDWLESQNLLSPEKECSLLDVACGMGGNLYYMSTRYPRCTITGLDLNPEVVRRGNAILRERGSIHTELQQADLYDLPHSHRGRHQGILFLQTLSWLQDWKEPLEQLVKLDGEWIAFSSLFYEGNIQCSIQVQDYGSGGGAVQKTSHYNIYSLPQIREYLSEKGYRHFSSVPFSMDIDLPKPENPGMGTYTEKLPDGRRLQLSGPLLMPWHFVVARKSP